MLLAALIAIIIMFRGNYDMTELLFILLCVMVIFYALGCFIQKKVYSFVKQIEEREAKEAQEAAKEGEVIEKEAMPEEEGSKET